MVVKERMKSVTIVSVALVCALVLAFSSPAAVSSQLVEPMSVFDPSFTTLDNGSGSISPSGSGSVTISGSTYAKRNAQQISVTASLQRWTGSLWSTVGSVTATDNNTSSVSTGTSFSSLEPGYYRVRTSHWTDHNGVFEHGYLYTGSVYVN